MGLWVCGAVFGQTAYELPEGFYRDRINTHLEVFIDEDRTMDFETVSSTVSEIAFTPLGTQAPNLGYQDGAVWVRFAVKNPAATPQDILVQLGWPRIDRVDFYARTPKTILHGWHGRTVPFTQQSYPDPMALFPLTLEPGQTQTVYFRLQTEFEVVFPTYIIDPDLKRISGVGVWSLVGTAYGMLLGLSIFSLLIFFRLRRPLYIYFTFSMLSFMGWWIINGVWLPAVVEATGSGDWPPLLITFVWMFFRAGFTRILLTLEIVAPSMNRLLSRLQFVAVPLFLVISLGANRRLGQELATIFTISAVAIELYAGILASRQGIRLARRYVFSTGGLVIGMLTAYLAFRGIIPIVPSISGFVIMVATGAELFGLAFALAESIQEVARHNEQILRQVEVDRLGALQSLVAGVTHELNTPVGALKSSADSLERVADRLTSAEDTESDKKRRRTLEALASLTRANRDATDRIDTVVRSLKTFARLDEADELVVDLHDGLSSALVLLESKMPSGVVVETHFRGPETVRCRAASIHQVFMSILDNALHAIKENGRIDIETDTVQDGIQIRIRDDGCGIPAHILDNLFTPKITSNVGPRSKLGMGLSTSKSILDQHDGTISVDSNLDRGTTVTVWLPLGV